MDREFNLVLMGPLCYGSAVETYEKCSICTSMIVENQTVLIGMRYITEGMDHTFICIPCIVNNNYGDSK